MNDKSMTAKISLFARWYHSQNNRVRIFDDTVAGRLLTEEEKQEISRSMSRGIRFFHPGFTGTAEEALRWIVDSQLAPAPLGRAAFCEKSLETAVRIGAGQYCILAAGYDTFAYRQPDWAGKLSIFEVDHPATAADKRARLKRAGMEIPENTCLIETDFNKASWMEPLTDCPAFHKNKITFCSLLGISYYLPPASFRGLLHGLSVLPKGSSAVFDYPDKAKNTAQGNRQAMLAEGAGEAMLASYTCEEMERLLAGQGFLCYEHLTPEQMTEQYFTRYNEANPEHPMSAFPNVNYCLAVKE